jgi:hypothetical protein
VRKSATAAEKPRVTSPQQPPTRDTDKGQGTADELRGSAAVQHAYLGGGADTDDT